MSNIVTLHPTRKVMTTVHRVQFELVPRAVMEDLFYAAISVGWSADDGEISATPIDVQSDAGARLEALQKAVGDASQFTTPVEREMEVSARQASDHASSIAAGQSWT